MHSIFSGWILCGLHAKLTVMDYTESLWSVPGSPQGLDISDVMHPEDARALSDTVYKIPGEFTQEEVDCLYLYFHRYFNSLISHKIG